MVANMSSKYNHRTAVIKSFHTGHEAKEIIEWFKYPKTMVYNLVKTYEALDNKGNFRPEYKTYKKCSGIIRTLSLLPILLRLSR